MSKSLTTMLVAMVAVLASEVRQTLAADPLLELELNEEGDILDVRDDEGSLRTAPIQGIPVDEEGLRFVTARSLFFAEVVSYVDGTVRHCCDLGGDNFRCLEAMRYYIDSAGEVTKVEGMVADKWVDLAGEDALEDVHTHASAEIRSLKSHAIAVFEDEEGERYGMVISGVVISPEERTGAELSMWYNPDNFKFADK